MVLDAFGRWRISRGLFGRDPKPIHQDRCCAFGGEDFPSIMKDHRRFAIAGPVVLTRVEQGEAILWLKCHFDQAHVIFLTQSVQSQDGSQDGYRFDTDQDGGMDPASQHLPGRGANEQIQGVLINLADLSRVGDREDKGRRRETFWGGCLRPERARRTSSSCSIPFRKLLTCL